MNNPWHKNNFHIFKLYENFLSLAYFCVNVKGTAEQKKMTKKKSRRDEQWKIHNYIMSTECESLNMKTDYYDDDDVWRVLKSLFLEQTHKDVRFLLLVFLKDGKKFVFLRFPLE